VSTCPGSGRSAEKVIKTLGLLGIMLSLAGALAAAPPASASSLAGSPGGYLPLPGKLGVYAINTVTGSAVAGADVVIVDLVTGQSIIKGLTRADGSYSTALPEGSYKVAIFAKGYKQQSELVKVTSRQTTITKIGIQPVNTLDPANPPVALI
jgi:Carboxypeptidase regulatory-like domain